ncbi:unnamed protein product [Prorocentrum cordatum]|uniref:Uncharacterized protein n=1 Tax=Prorocentrum cordatum TaxID=2364126 RepID=A0ABN9TAY6_9DINO|nr:unnamed protein product [Polarella glacialis]
MHCRRQPHMLYSGGQRSRAGCLLFSLARIPKQLASSGLAPQEFRRQLSVVVFPSGDASRINITTTNRPLHSQILVCADRPIASEKHIHTQLKRWWIVLSQ